MTATMGLRVYSYPRVGSGMVGLLRVGSGALKMREHIVGVENAGATKYEKPAVDFCEVCLMAQRDTRIALVPCGDQRFCESCANEMHNQGRGCPLCRTPINMLLRLYELLTYA